MNRIILLVSLLLVIISCDEQGIVENGQYNQPNADFDLDGKSNQDELNKGENPYINNSLANNYLGESKTTLKLRLRTDRDFREELSFFNLKDSIKLFNEKAFLVPTFSELQKKDNLFDKQIYFKNVLACISRGQMKSLQVKHKDFSLGDVDIITSLDKYKEHLDTNFYIYDFKTLENIYFFESQQKDSSYYKSHRFNLDYAKLEKDFCILYDDPKTKVNGLRPVFKLVGEKLEKYFVVEKYLKGMSLNQSLKLGAYQRKGHVYYNPKNTDLRKYNNSDSTSKFSDLDSSSFSEGDYVTVLRYVSSKIKYRTHSVGSSSSYRRTHHGKNRTQPVSFGCTHYQVPYQKELSSFKSLTDIKLSDLVLKFNGKSILPTFVNGFYVEYYFMITNDMLVDGKLNFRFLKESTDKYEYKSLFYNQGTDIQNGSNSSHSSRRYCSKPFRKVSVFSDFKEFDSTFFIKKN